ncbi:hypothetical protein FBUS_03119 [Fasciolopsis buskii]|uniref:Uncharacterized protein n=1 Tax=Fasciolopsis buskii TaxID=27845 RepID=A0A8E0RWH9_9TREM|nr:hypothetical protein FBUS_03119 [Fasciolopsis buski]
MRKLEQSTGDLNLQNLNLRAKIQGLEQCVEQECKVRAQVQKQFKQLSIEYKVIQEQTGTRQSQLDQAEICINRLNTEMRRVHSTLEAGSKKVQELSTELQTVSDQWKHACRERDDLLAKYKQVSQDNQNYRATHQTADDVVCGKGLSVSITFFLGFDKENGQKLK